MGRKAGLIEAKSREKTKMLMTSKAGKRKGKQITRKLGRQETRRLFVQKNPEEKCALTFM